MEPLAICGGKPVRSDPFPPYKTYDDSEIQAVVEVIKDGIISEYVGAPGRFFMGGKKVQELESMYAAHCGTKHAVAMNSATSCIIAGMAAFGLGPGDEVVVTPYSHVISATAPLMFDAVPVFADSEPDTLCMSADSLRKCITPRTRAVIVVDTFGQSADLDPIMELARGHGLFVYSDSAHTTWATYKGRRAGSCAHMGSYSLNAHKSVQSGEGGVVVTNDDDLALKLQMIRNHAENCVEGFNYADLTNMVGYNFRMTELEAAVAVEQLKKSETLVKHRVKLCKYLTEKISEIDGLTPTILRDGCTHDYLLFPVLYEPSKFSIHRDDFMKRLDADGLRMVGTRQWHVAPLSGFVKPIHLLPIFQKKQFRPGGYPWTCPEWKGEVSYEKGICPVCEDLWENRLFCLTAIYPPLDFKEMDQIVEILEKVAWHSR
ncbi:DegT/DnrJ/EryC1/StrS family aminotransferase [Candidatus Parcubacteria bacterium]|nr:MAG: DegT/DnrJ/EryC1/StrS family aminotransferase [Candidatus Parcubacteria bacterium]